MTALPRARWRSIFRALLLLLVTCVTLTGIRWGVAYNIKSVRTVSLIPPLSPQVVGDGHFTFLLRRLSISTERRIPFFWRFSPPLSSKVETVCGEGSYT